MKVGLGRAQLNNQPKWLQLISIPSAFRRPTNAVAVSC